jgi:predicted ATPase/DNA-binding CsgD family transcriptional regulator
MTTTDSGRVGNLPQELTSFVGRTRQLAEIKQCLSTARLVTLHGPAGVGKTRLSLRIAAESQRVYPDGAWLIELAPLRDASLLAETVAAALRLPERAGVPPLDTLTDFLRPRTLLLVLDNCEHLIEGCAKLADRLLRDCPDLRILATSREPLMISGEATLPVPPLSVPHTGHGHAPAKLDRYEAVALFTERSATVLPTFAVTADNADAVAAICQRLDGLPLAVELAAARLRVLSPAQILDRLTDRFHLLTGGSRTGPSRQKTLRACIDWSFDLCTAAERLLWARLTVFAGGFELDAVEEVCAGDGIAPEDTWDIVSSLVDKSIVLREGTGPTVRYRLLEAIREYGSEALRAADEEAVFRRRHRDWVDRMVSRAEADLLSSAMVEWWARLDRELPNIRAALEFCLAEPGKAEAGLRMVLALHAHWTRRRLTEGRQWIDRMLARQPGPPTSTWARALYDAVLLACFQGDLPAAAALADRARELADELGDERSRAFMLHAAAHVAMFSADAPRAVECYEQVLDLHRAADDQVRLLEALIGLSIGSGLSGDGARVVACNQEMLAITEPRGELKYRSYALWGIGFAMWRQGELEQAAELLQQSLRFKLLVDDALSASFCIDVLGWVAASAHDYTRAAHLMGCAEALALIALSPLEVQPEMRQFHDDCVRRSREALGDHRYEATFRVGAKQTFAEAVAYAVGDEPDPVPAEQPAPETTLTPRERQVTELVADGLTNKDIAARLAISPRTVEGHVERILAKLEFGSRAQIAAWVATAGSDRAAAGRQVGDDAGNGPDASTATTAVYGTVTTT